MVFPHVISDYVVFKAFAVVFLFWQKYCIYVSLFKKLTIGRTLKPLYDYLLKSNLRKITNFINLQKCQSI